MKLSSACTLERSTAPESGPRDPQKNEGEKRGLAVALALALALAPGTPWEEPSRPEESQQTHRTLWWPRAEARCPAKPAFLSLTVPPASLNTGWLPSILYRNQRNKNTLT